ncbi:MAG: hypothetical protein J6Z03_01455 [Erysipelotrichaceae bacterium]|nr:hypothetical protein [Erysipelotrichaceae bacterium]
MTFIEDNNLEKVSGGQGIADIINTKDVLNYIMVLSESPGIIERLRMNDLSDDDVTSIEKHFVSESRFIAVARFAHDKTVEELMAIAAANDNR